MPITQRKKRLRFSSKDLISASRNESFQPNRATTSLSGSDILERSRSGRLGSTQETGFFAPEAGKIRVRDFFRESIGLREKGLGAVGDVTRTFLQAFPRAVFSTALTFAPRKVRENIGEIRPEEDIGKVGKFVFGDAPIKTIADEGEGILKDLGVSEEQAKEFGIPVGLGLTVLDLDPGFIGGPGKGKAFRAIANSKNADEIFTLLRPLVKGSDDHAKTLSRLLASADNPKSVSRVIEAATEKLPRSLLGDVGGLEPRIARETVETFQRPKLKITRKKPAPTKIQRQIKKTVEPRVSPRIAKSEMVLLKKQITDTAAGVRVGKKVATDNIRRFQDDAVNLIKKTFPTELRGQFLAQIPKTTNLASLNKTLDKTAEALTRLEKLQDVHRAINTNKQKIAFLRRVGEFSQKALSKAKEAVGIDEPLGTLVSKVKRLKRVDTPDGKIKAQRAVAQLDALVKELGKRLEFKKSRGFVAENTVTSKASPAKTIPNEVYDQVAKVAPPNKIKTAANETAQNIKLGADKALGIISTRLGNVDKSLKKVLRRYEFDTMTKQTVRMDVYDSFYNKIKKSSKEDGRVFDFAALNGDSKKIAELAAKYNFEKELPELRRVLDDVYKEANEVGFDIGYRKGWFPRVVKDAEGLMNYHKKQSYWGSIEEAIERQSTEFGQYLSIEEQAQLANTMVRGYSGGNITLKKLGSMEHRIIDFVDPNMAKFYESPRTAIAKYIGQATEAIEQRRFFGKSLQLDPKQNVNLKDSIGGYMVKLIAEGKIEPHQERIVRDIFEARFNPGKTGALVGAFKNLGYLDTMGSPRAAITQLGDLGMAFFRAGIKGTLKNWSKALVGKSKITTRDLGMAKKIAAELENSTLLGKAVDRVFRASGLTFMDKLGKESLVNGAMEGMQVQARGSLKQVEKLRKHLLRSFSEAEADSFISKLKDDVTDNEMKFLAFNELLDFQPAALSEVPEKYLRAGNGKIFYQLKTWTLKAMDIYRREVFQEMKTDPVGGMKNFMLLTTSLVAMNSTADGIKDFMMGRDFDLGDTAVDNMWKLAGFSRYTAGQALRTDWQQKGAGRVLIEQILPPTDLYDDLWKDVTGAFKDHDESARIQDLNSIENIPLGGELYYWWLGKGSSKSKTKSKTKKRRTLR